MMPAADSRRGRLGVRWMRIMLELKATSMVH